LAPPSEARSRNRRSHQGNLLLGQATHVLQGLPGSGVEPERSAPLIEGYSNSRSADEEGKMGATPQHLASYSALGPATKPVRSQQSSACLQATPSWPISLSMTLSARPPFNTACTITDDSHQSALRSIRNRPRTAMHRGATCSYDRPLATPRPSCTVSNLSAHSIAMPCAAGRRLTPQYGRAGRCGAKHGSGGHCVGAALASHGRVHERSSVRRRRWINHSSVVSRLLRPSS
jgi:hypothetical protein